MPQRKYTTNNKLTLWYARENRIDILNHSPWEIQIDGKAYTPEQLAEEFTEGAYDYIMNRVQVAQDLIDQCAKKCDDPTAGSWQQDHEAIREMILSNVLAKTIMMSKQAKNWKGSQLWLRRNLMGADKAIFAIK